MVLPEKGSSVQEVDLWANLYPLLALVMLHLAGLPHPQITRLLLFTQALTGGTLLCDVIFLRPHPCLRLSSGVETSSLVFSIVPCLWDFQQCLAHSRPSVALCGLGRGSCYGPFWDQTIVT